jgi:hypothetical protein
MGGGWNMSKEAFFGTLPVVCQKSAEFKHVQMQ